MTSVDIKTPAGKIAGKVELPVEIFGVEHISVPLIHQVVVAQLAAKRAGTAKVKDRGEVSGAGRKPFKQKGTGRARQGSIRAPQMYHGGVVHGPVPRDYEQRTPKKMKAAALRHALTDRAREGHIHIVTSIVEGETPSTKAALTALGAVASAKRVLVVLDETDLVSAFSLRNLPNVHWLTAGQLNTYDVLVADDVVFTKAAYDTFIAGPVKGKSVSAVASESEIAE